MGRSGGEDAWMIRYLETWEKKQCRSLWEEAFPEDSRPFDDYYFTEKMKDNRVLVLEEDGRLVSMLHQNPYRIRVREQVWRSDYIVGVATAGDRRHRGYMRQLLNRMMGEMWAERMPFCFLMPADEAIYRPFGFTYIFDQPKWELAKTVPMEVRPLLPWKDSLGGNGWLAELASWMDRWLENRYEVYAVRDEAYLRRLMKELESENGTLDVLYDRDAMAGIHSEWGLEEKEQRLLMVESRYQKQTGVAKPAIMARIICLEQFIKAIRLNEGVAEEELCIRLNVDDPLVAQNHGLWNWNINRETSWLERSTPMADCGIGPEGAGSSGESVAAVREGLQISIAELTGWLFGYGVPEAAGGYGDMVETLNGVFLDEIV